jgi:hypothetical protein
MDERMVEAEMRRLERLLGLRKRELDELEQKADLKRPRNRRYNSDFVFPFQNDPAVDYIYVEDGGVTINNGTRFFLKELQMGFQVTSEGATFDLGPSFMRLLFDFEWRIRDTGSDREWSNDWLPSDFLYSGDIRGLDLGKNHALLSGGSEVIISIRTTKSSAFGTGNLFDVIEGFNLQIGLVGIEVPEAFGPDGEGGV